jgi:site-specific recombinase XerD
MPRATTTPTYPLHSTAGIRNSPTRPTPRRGNVAVPFPPTWQDDWLAYELAELARGHSPHSIATRRSSVAAFAVAHPDQRAGTITRTDLVRYFAGMQNRRTPGGVRSAHNDLRSFFRWVAADYGLDASPMAGIPRPKLPPPRTPVLALEQIRAILAACAGKDEDDLRDRAIVLLLFETGMRRAECAALNLADVSMEQRVITICHGKGDKERKVKLQPDTWDAIRRYLRVRRSRGTDALFTNCHAERLTYSGIGQLLRRRGDMAGVRGLRAHLLRHAAVHYCKVAGMQENNIVTMMGWTSPAQLRRYAATMNEERSLADAEAHPLGALLRRP